MWHVAHILQTRKIDIFMHFLQKITCVTRARSYSTRVNFLTRDGDEHSENSQLFIFITQYIIFATLPSKVQLSMTLDDPQSNAF